MKKTLIFTLTICCSLNAYAQDVFNQYSDLKKHMNTQYGINFGLNSTFTKQYITSGKNTLQEIIFPYCIYAII